MRLHTARPSTAEATVVSLIYLDHINVCHDALSGLFHGVREDIVPGTGLRVYVCRAICGIPDQAEFQQSSRLSRLRHHLNGHVGDENEGQGKTRRCQDSGLFTSKSRVI